MLEAVHLLLAFELFVVVVAVDSRWLSFALTDELGALDSLNRGGRKATPQDYLEKIFQLPFWVQPLSIDGRGSLVHGLLESSVSAPSGSGATGGANGGGLALGPREEELLTAMLSRRGAAPQLDAHLLALTPDDLSFMESLAPLLGDTPRRVKRFVNVTQLLLALPPALDRDASNPRTARSLRSSPPLTQGCPAWRHDFSTRSIKPPRRRWMRPRRASLECPRTNASTWSPGSTTGRPGASCS